MGSWGCGPETQAQQSQVLPEKRQEPAPWTSDTAGRDLLSVSRQQHGGSPHQLGALVRLASIDPLHCADGPPQVVATSHR